MTYINPETYNWKDLKDDEAILMEGYNICMENVETASENIIEEISKDFGDSQTLATIVNEICESFSVELSTWLNMNRTELTCSLMENNLEKYGEED